MKFVTGAVYAQTIINTNSVTKAKNLAQVAAIGCSDLNFGTANRKIIYSLDQAQQLGYTNNSAYSLNSYIYLHFANSSQPLVVYNIFDKENVDHTEDYTEVLPVVNNRVTTFRTNPINVKATTFEVKDGLTVLVYGTDYTYTDENLLKLRNGLNLQEVTVTYKVINKTNILQEITDLIVGTPQVTSVTKDQAFRDSGLVIIPFYNDNIGVMQALAPELPKLLLQSFVSDATKIASDIREEIENGGVTSVYGAINSDCIYSVATEGSYVYLRSMNAIQTQMDVASLYCACLSGLGSAYNKAVGQGLAINGILKTAVCPYSIGYSQVGTAEPTIETGNIIAEKGVNLLTLIDGKYSFFGWFTTKKKTSTGEDAYGNQMRMRFFNTILITNALAVYLQSEVTQDQLALIEMDVTNKIINNNQSFILSVDGALLFEFKLDGAAFSAVSIETQNSVRIPFTFKATFTNCIESIYFTNTFDKQGFETYIQAIVEQNV